MSIPITRTASCACGHLAITTKGEPELVSSCSCTDCQKRTGSAFGVTAFFNTSQFELVSGQPKVFNRGSASGRTLAMNFCPECGTTLFWNLEAYPGRVVVAAGCFADPSFPAPVRHVWAKRKHHWVEFPECIQLHPENP